MHSQNVFDIEKLSPLLSSNMWKNIKLLASDFDGVLGHTEPFQMRAFQEVAETHGQAPTIVIEFNELVKEMLGKPEATILSILKDRHDIPHSVDTLLSMRGDAYLSSALQNVIPNPYAHAILREAEKDEKRCIVLSNGRSHVLNALNEHWGIDHHFAEMRSVDQRPIPDKTDYLLARAKKDGIDPDQILVLEDSVGTIKKAQRNGIQTVYFHHELNDPNFVPESNIVIPCINPTRPAFTRQYNYPAYAR